MKYNAPSKCPVCQQPLTVTKLVCEHCHTGIDGNFKRCDFCNLSKEESEFLKIFVGCSGSIKEVERVMGISYPTVKSKLNQLIKTLDVGIDTSEGTKGKKQIEEERKAIINQVETGEISAKKAAELLSKLK